MSSAALPGVLKIITVQTHTEMLHLLYDLPVSLMPMANIAPMLMTYSTTIDSSIRTKSLTTRGILLKNTMIPRWPLTILQM